MVRVEKTLRPNVTNRFNMSETRTCLAIGGPADGDMLRGPICTVLVVPRLEPCTYVMSKDMADITPTVGATDTYHYMQWSVAEGNNVGFWVHEHLNTTQAFYKLLYRYTNNPTKFEQIYGEHLPKTTY